MIYSAQYIPAELFLLYRELHELHENIQKRRLKPLPRKKKKRIYTKEHIYKKRKKEEKKQQKTQQQQTYTIIKTEKNLQLKNLQL